MREGIHERIQAEIHQGNKEEEARAEEMLEVPPEWNKVLDLMMEEEDIYPRLQDLPFAHSISRDYKIQRDSILKIGMKFSRKELNGKCQISGRESYR